MVKRQLQLSAKRIAIDKANTSVLIAVGTAIFIVVFSLIASKALLSQRSYQATVITKKEQALKQLKTNVKEAEKLVIAYQEFNGAPTNVLGGNPKGNGDKDGENSRIVLDALPSKYDFPALTTSLNKLVTTNGFSITGMSGTDDEIGQAKTGSSESPAAIDMPFKLDSKIATADGKRFMELFERSIRPIQIQKITITEQGGQLQLSITAKTYYQPGKNLDIKTETVKNGKQPSKNQKKASTK